MADTRHHIITDLSRSGQLAAHSLDVVRFQETFSGDCLSVNHSFHTEMNYLDLIAKIRELTPDQTYKLKSYDGLYLSLQSKDALFFLNGHMPGDCEGVDPWTTGIRSITLTGYGAAVPLKAVMDYIRALPKHEDSRVIAWNYILEGRRMEMNVYLDEPQPTPDVFYPYVKGGLDAYFQQYMESSATVLLLRGEPGTGKTSFIRNLIWRSNLDTMITYEEQLYRTDEMFVSFMTNHKYDLLVMEDADQMLTSREDDSNRIMAKFLNVADGLIRLPKKKIVISSNVMEERKIDSALLRPGRCFDRPFFRKLTGREAATAAEAAGKPFHGSLNGEYTLAEILNPPARERENKIVGFVGPSQSVANG